MSEEQLSQRVADYMRYQRPDCIYHFDFGSGTKLTIGQSIKNKKLNKRAWPDLFIAGGKDKGLFLELKRDGVSVYLKDGSLSRNAHIREQAETLEKLREAGYQAEFAIGYDMAVRLIERYLGQLKRPSQLEGLF